MSTAAPLPWYRHFWPWFVLGLLGISVTGSLTTVYIAVSGRDPEVRGTWSRDAKAVVLDDAAERLARSLALSAALVVAVDHERLDVTLDAAPGLAPESIAILLVHPTLAGRDLELVATRTEGHLYTAALPPTFEGRSVQGRYQVSIRGRTAPVAGSDGEDWKLAAPIEIVPGEPARIGSPRSDPR